MTKREFLDILEGRLQDLPAAEREEYIAYYCELIDDMIEEGCTEQAAISRLEDIDLIVGRILGEKIGKDRDAATSPQGTPMPRAKSSRGCFRAFIIVAVTLIIVTLVLSYAGIVVVGKVFDGLQTWNTPENGALRVEEKISSSVDITEEGVEIRVGDFKLSVTEKDGVHINGKLANKADFGSFTLRSETAEPAAWSETHILGEVSAEDIESIDISWISASVRLEPHGEDTIRAIEWSADPLTTEEGGIMEVRGDCLQISYASKDSRISLPGKRLVVYLPEELYLDSLNVKTVSADVILNGLQGEELYVETVSGNIDACGFEELGLVTTSGDIHTCGPWEEALIATVSGKAQVSEPGEETSIGTVSGDVTLFTGEDYSLDYKTASGDLVGGGANPWSAGSGRSHIRVATTSGDLNLE